ncbi:hypothetical protein [Marinicella meishanensis]|uniref:hypothetical protein n=1 Tax=Marinicella meishanensis TaxID=2873263 RepID=UPI001CBC3468|nr:hypothetical protein [Marinicella sp. NBU2979]
MKARTFIYFCLLSLTGMASVAAAVSLEEAVNQVKHEGRVLSAKTINGQHEIKVLTPSGTVKTFNKSAGKPSAEAQHTRPEYYNRGGRSMRDRKSNQAIPNRFKSTTNDRRRNNRQMDLQPMMLEPKNNPSKNSNKNKNKDK